VNPPRSVLCVPGSSARMLDKALSSAADQVVIDLEDAVSPDAKNDARALTAAFLSDLADRDRVAVRVNGRGTEWSQADLESVGPLVRSVVLPKVESGDDLAFADALLPDGVQVQALIESAAGLVRLDEICAASTGLSALIIGYADLGVSLQRGSGCPPSQWIPAQERVLWAARAAGIAAIDGPHLGVRVDEEFTAAVQHAAAVGFDGKWVIHPAQIDTVNEAFSPTQSEIDWARRVIEALDGAGAVQLDGRMLDEALAAGARRVLARAKVTP